MALTEDQIDGLIQAVRKTAKTEILPHFRNLDVAAVDTKSAVDDLVTIADRASEVAIAAAARRILPGTAIVGEEAVAEDPSLLKQIGAADRCVIIDPIDGTWNFAKGVATFGVILAVVEDGQTVFGLLYDPICDDWIMATKDGGAWFCRPGVTPRRLQLTGQPERLEDAFGFIALYLYSQEWRPQIAAQLPGFLRTYSLRCSCHEYRVMAEGHAAFNLNGMMNPWDHAAGVLIMQEAGGTIQLIDGTPYSPTMTEGRLLAAATPKLWDLMAERFSFLI